jgi:hypothetical protein
MVIADRVPTLSRGLLRPGHSSGCPDPRSDRFAITSHRPRNRRKVSCFRAIKSSCAPLGCGLSLMWWTAPTTGIASCQFSAPINEPPMSHIGYKRSSSYARGRSGLPPTTDFRAAKSAFPPISSASPSGADSQGGGAKGPNLTHRRHRARWGPPPFEIGREG